MHLVDPLMSDDTQSSLDCVRKLGVCVLEQSLDNKMIVLQGALGRFLQGGYALDFDCGNSGTTMRLLAGLCAGYKGVTRFAGDASLNKRDMARVLVPLSLMGVKYGFEGTAGCAPFHLMGNRPLDTCNIALEIASAQVVSALAFAALFGARPITIAFPHPVRNHTTNMLLHLGIDIQESIRDSQCLLRVSHPDLVDLALDDIEICVPGDISSAAFFMCYAAMVPGSDLLLRGVGLNPGRTLVVDVLTRMGADIEVIDCRNAGLELVGDLRVRGGRALSSVEISADEIARGIDELPMLAFVMATCSGLSKVRGAQELRAKESDRLRLMQANLALLGVRMDIDPDNGDYYVCGQGDFAAFYRKGKSMVHAGAEFCTAGDHRLAMIGIMMQKLFAGLHVEAEDCHSVSYPDFKKDLLLVSN